MKAHGHRESWLAWILSGLAALVVFAVFWFYVVFHRLLGLSFHQLTPPFVVLAILVLCFSMAAKPSREEFINRNRLGPLAFAVWSLLCLLSLWFVYYAQKFGYFDSFFARICYVVAIVVMPILGFLTFPILRQMIGEFKR
jgi:multisubunit Na+/H+ antiporter MnhB subunit